MEEEERSGDGGDAKTDLLLLPILELMLILRAKGLARGRVTNPRRVVERPTAVAATSRKEDEEEAGSMVVVVMVIKPNNPKRRRNRVVVEGVAAGAFLGIRGCY